jgi:lipopolysaccharide transport system ATP-binding protein
MSRHSIVVDHLSKSYRLGMAPQMKTFREALTDAAVALFRRARGERPEGAGGDTFWALRDVSFEVEPGEVIGIVGRNGAGKSTLLKILSRITEPTAGTARLRGVVSSLLEVGTGFHPELTGRENVFLIGSILGMRKAEIDRKFDEIVAFAQIEKFLDTAVKYYSSGMFVRLAFAVAAHLETQILIVDEVLAVGDAAFQRKCLGRIEEVTREGRTVLFVSHNMPTVLNLCTRCLYLEQGAVKMDGDPRAVLEAYTSATMGRMNADASLEGHQGRTSDSTPIMKEVRVRGLGASSDFIYMGDDVEVEVRFEAETPLVDPTFRVHIKNNVSAGVFGADTDTNPPPRLGVPMTAGSIKCRIGKIPLMPGSYTLDLFLGIGNMSIDSVFDACRFEVHPADVFGTGKLPLASTGSIYWPSSWEVVPERAVANAV